MTPDKRVESLVSWYLRFNGYFLTPNFTVHPDTKKGQGAEADILAVRFPHSRENPGRYCFDRDDELVVESKRDFLIVEAKSGYCALNDTWTEPDRRNIQYALRWIGCFESDEQIEAVATTIYQCGRWEDDDQCVRLVSIGSKKTPEIYERYPCLLQVELLRAAEFVRTRLTTGCARLNRNNWDTYCQEFAQRSADGLSSADLLNWTLGG